MTRKWVFYLLLTVLVAKAAELQQSPYISNQNDLKERIIGGSVASILRHAHQVSIRRRYGPGTKYEHHCGGSILDSRTILTAAHCVYNYNSSNFLVVAGSDYSEYPDGVITRIEKIVVHEQYNPSLTNNDIALIFLEPELMIDNETVMSIELETKQPKDGTKAIVTGWGQTDDDSYSTILLQAQVSIVDNERCQESYSWRPITSGMICAGMSSGGYDACSGDSGGPLVVSKKLAGIVSWSYSCGAAEYPGVYANVAFYGEWIAKERGENSQFGRNYYF